MQIIMCVLYTNKGADIHIITTNAIRNHTKASLVYSQLTSDYAVQIDAYLTT